MLMPFFFVSKAVSWRQAALFKMYLFNGCEPDETYRVKVVNWAVSYLLLTAACGPTLAVDSVDESGQMVDLC